MIDMITAALDVGIMTGIVIFVASVLCYANDASGTHRDRTSLASLNSASSRRLPSLRCATPLFALRPEFLARLTVQAFGIGLIRARFRGCLFTCGAGGCRRRRSLRRRDGAGDDERQDGRAKCHRSHGASSLNKSDEAAPSTAPPRSAMNSRRLMGLPKARDHWSSIAGQRRASQQKRAHSMSASGQARTKGHLGAMSALPLKADMRSRHWDVGFVP